MLHVTCTLHKKSRDFKDKYENRSKILDEGAIQGTLRVSGYVKTPTGMKIQDT